MMNTSSALIIRGQRSDDWESLFALWNTGNFLLNSFELPYASEDSFRERFGTSPANTHTLIAESSVPSGRRRIMGVAWLLVLQNRMRHCGQLSMIVQAGHHDAETGLMDAILGLADQWLGLRRIEVMVFVEDAISVELYRQYGFEIEATMGRYALRNGVLADAYLMARLHKLSGEEQTT